MIKEEHNIETLKNQEDHDYNHALENINASLKKSKKEDRNGLKKLYLRRNEEARLKSKSVVKEIQESDLKKSLCKNNADIR